MKQQLEDLVLRSAKEAVGHGMDIIKTIKYVVFAILALIAVSALSVLVITFS